MNKIISDPYDDQRTKQVDPFITCQSSSLWMMLKHIDPTRNLNVNDVINWFDTDESRRIYTNMMKKGIFEAWMNNYRKRELWKMLEIGGNCFLNDRQESIDKKVKFSFESFSFVSSLMNKVEESIVENSDPVMIGFRSHLNGADFHHIFVVVGVNDTCFICHDPYGDWNKHYQDKNIIKADGTYPGQFVSYHKDNLKQHINKHGLFIRSI